MRRNLWLALPAVCVFAFACGGGAKEEAPAATEQPAAAAAVDDANAGGVTGTVTYAGPDDDTAIAMNADPVCAGLHKEPIDTQTIVTDGAGHLGNVFVYVKSGLEGKTFPAPEGKAVIDQQGCMYHPRVQGVRVGQAVEIKNSDATLHNIHALPTKNTEFNQGQPFQNMTFEKTFDQPEVMVHFKCDVHPWMSSYMGVVEHPFFAVSNPDGTFSIAKLPPGTYTLEAWHEKLGTQTQQVTVAPNQDAQVTFDFKPAA